MITIDFARTLYPADADSAHDFDHILRVLHMAEKIAQTEGADIDVVRVAALLHDIGLDQGRAGHEISAANRAREILKNLAKGSATLEDSTQQPSQGYSDEFIEAVAHAIESHRFRSGPAPDTLEAKVLFDADKLDSIGAIGIARAFAFGGWRGQKLWADVPADYT
ncbi:MAG TPA: HD domain-containing protein, partial [Anaerolineae bacterium]|nr:HD domain-containing protein [Anaerolineae bacterium]